MITVVTKTTGRKRPLLPNWQLPVPPDFTDSVEPVTLRQLISTIVAAQVEAFNDRLEQDRFVKILSERELSDAAATGKINLGGNTEDRTQACPEAAIGAALQAFEDGLYLVFLDDEEQRDLDREVYLSDDCTVTFLRLTMLAGG